MRTAELKYTYEGAPFAIPKSGVICDTYDAVISAPHLDAADAALLPEAE